MRHHTIQSQFELFPGVVGNSEKKTDLRFALKSITISVENLFVLIVMIVLSLVVAFSIGIERGKQQLTQPQEPPLVINRPALVFRPAEQEVKEELLTEMDTVEAVPAKVVTVAQDPAPALPEVPAQETDKIYTVQVASFKKEHHAQQEAQSLENNGYEIFVLPKGKYSIVCVGKFAQRDQAKEFSQRLRQKYKDCLIRRL